MIQFNLLPDIKLAYMKAQRSKRMMSSISFISATAALGLLLFSLFIVHVVQKATIRSADSKIEKLTKEVKATPELNKILTVQNQLGSLTGLHESKPLASRMFGYLSQITPTDVTLNKLDVDFTASTLSIAGDAPSLDVVRVYADTLKSTKFSTGNEQPKNAFSEVVLQSFSKTDKGTSYGMNFKFDPQLFLVQNEVQLHVPKGAKTSQDQLFSQNGGM